MSGKFFWRSIHIYAEIFVYWWIASLGLVKVYSSLLTSFCARDGNQRPIDSIWWIAKKRCDLMEFWWLRLCVVLCNGGRLERTFNSIGLCLPKSSLHNWKCLFSQFDCNFNGLLVQHIIHRDGNVPTAANRKFSPPTPHKICKKSSWKRKRDLKLWTRHYYLHFK